MCKHVCRNWVLKYKIQYEIQCFGLGSLRDTLCRVARVNHELITLLSISITGLPNTFYMQRIVQRWLTKVDLSIPECTMWYSQ